MSSIKTLSYAADVGVHGVFLLSVQIGEQLSAVRGVLLDLLVLHELEAITRSFEDTFKHPVDWHPSPKQECVVQSLELILDFAPSTPVVRSIVSLPIAVLPKLATWRISQMDNLADVSWQPLASTLCLSQLRLSGEECADLAEGALVLIPESFHSEWETTLMLDDCGVSIRGMYQWPTDSWLHKTSVSLEKSDNEQANEVIDLQPDTAQSNEPDRYRVQFACRIDPAALMQAGNAINPGLPKILADDQGNDGLWLQNEEGVRFRGQLMALGTGQAILLQHHEAMAV